MAKMIKSIEEMIEHTRGGKVRIRCHGDCYHATGADRPLIRFTIWLARHEAFRLVDAVEDRTGDMTLIFVQQEV